MWTGNIEEFKNCDVLSEEAKACVVHFINNNDMQTLPNGRYDLENGDYVNIFEYETKESDGIFELHKEYIDIHCVILGEEKILCTDKYAQEIKAYQEDGDYSLGIASIFKEIEIVSELCIFLPNEPHKAGVSLHKATKVKKAVFKIVNNKS